MPTNHVVFTNGKTFTEILAELGAGVEITEIGDNLSQQTKQTFRLMPFWFEDMGNGRFRLHNFKSLPAKLHNYLKEMPDQILENRILQIP
jgi:hypothetical protein